MANMYDKLGCLLRDALEKGSIPQEPPQADAVSAAENRRIATQSKSCRAGGKEAHEGVPFKSTRRAKRLHAASVVGALNKKSAPRGSVCKEGKRPVPYTPPLITPLTDEAKAAENRRIATQSKSCRAAYAVLGLKCGASAAEIKAAWRKKLKMFHPDENSANEVVQKVAKQKTLEVMEAYRVLGGKGQSI